MEFEYLEKKGIASETLYSITTILWNGLSPNALDLSPKDYNKMNNALSKCVEKLQEKEKKQ